jgi:3-dehydroquinate synthase
MAKVIKVGKRYSQYDVNIFNKNINKASLVRALKSNNKVLIITDSGIPKRYLNDLKFILRPLKKLYVQEIPQGESSKSYSSLMLIHEKLSTYKFDRSDCILAFGGGVVGDLAGFAASTYLRGIDYIQVPTTLLSQVDSSVGGKTAINIDAGKNLVGAFYNPKCVLINIDYLNSLSDKQFLSGMAEVAKYAYIGNKKIKNKNSHILSMLIEESIKTKARIVTKDEKESGIRAILNFGHTFGHAIEAKNKFNLISHGQAVAYGMVIAGKISLLEGLINKKYLNTLIANLDKIGLDTDISKFRYQELKKYIENDKKVSEGKLNLILIDNRKAFKTNKFNPKNLQAALS